MSEYQYYEWQTIDRPLSSQERDAVNGLSSHITVTATSAWVDYSWSDFKHDPLDVLARYFDAFLYMANWGSKQLAFRFPADLLDPRPLQSYIVAPYISLKAVDDYRILNFDLAEEEPSDFWIEAEGWLGTLASLRNDILRGDYRLLHLAWLRAVELDGGYEIADDEPEPPVPPGLHQLTAALQAFVDWCELDENLIVAAARASTTAQETPETNWAAAIGHLSRQECNQFLLRLVRDEPHLGLSLRRRLQEMTESVAGELTSPQRRVEELLAIQAERVAAEERRQAEAARQRHLREMEELARREPEIWQEVTRLLETSYSTRHYDEATQHLLKLRQLAEHRGSLPAFQERIDELVQRYRRRTSLLARFRKKQLI